MKYQFLLLCSVCVLFVLNSCEKPTNVTSIDTSYLQGLEGSYSIECSGDYSDSVGMYQYFDTSYVGTLTHLSEDLMQLEFIDGSSLELEFTYDNYVRTNCSINGFSYQGGNWMVEDNVPVFGINQNYIYCINGFSGSYLNLSIQATKL